MFLLVAPWLYVIPLGIVWALVYYLVFSFCIRKFKVAIPGMQDDLETVNVTG